MDNLLVECGLAESRSRAQGMILAGSVRVGGEVVTKSGSRHTGDAEISVEERSPYVSRAGEKLAGALDEFGVEVGGRDCLDAGASTGGFTDVLLQRGASRVISADVGYGQLDWSLRNDPRVEVLERTNIRYLSVRDLPFEPDLLVGDLSFISLPVALAGVAGSAENLREMVLLVKPQFEAGPEQVGRGGVVRDPLARAAAITRVAEEFERLGFGAVDLTRASVTGRRSGNQEYPLRLLRGSGRTLTAERISEISEISEAVQG
ncbi:TlyA family RNA methyltransferase [Rubrobacter aplysinae]|uniref:TlyA family RNA methyltransferase n=1 Tax=Rubrobacter aplysinae TaxID=909625 RepID=UPI00064B8C5D